MSNLLQVNTGKIGADMGLPSAGLMNKQGVKKLKSS